MTAEQMGFNFGSILATEIIPGIIGLYIGWRCLVRAARRDKKEKETNETDKT